MTHLVPLGFEAPIIELENKIAELRRIDLIADKNSQASINALEKRLEKAKKEIYKNLTPTQKVQIARHPSRPYTLDYINLIFTDFTELKGDRCYGDDQAIVGGMAKFDGESVMVVGHQKGRNTKENIARNFGMAHPEGYRKAVRLFKMASKFNRPIITFIDTPGAYPGLGAEERGQAEAIAKALFEMALLRVPLIACIAGEGGSGGALGLAMGNRVIMLEHAVYSVISPEGCASILWKDASNADKAAEALKMTAQDMLELGVIDEIIPEPSGGAHRAYEEIADNVRKSIKKHLAELKTFSPEELAADRYKKFRNMGEFSE